MNVVVMTDWEGVIVDTVPGLTKVSIEAIGEFFPTEKLEGKAEELAASFGGGSFASSLERALEAFYPGEKNRDSRERCCQLALVRRESVYDGVKLFPRAEETIKEIAKSHHVVLSSALERAIFDKCLQRTGFARALFDAIYCLEDGTKDLHVKDVRKNFPRNIVVYVGDSFSEMRLVKWSIGVTENPRIKAQFFENGAKAVISSISYLEKVLSVLNKTRYKI